MRYRIYDDAYPIIITCLLLSPLAYLIHYYLFILSIIIIIITIFIFRDPIRVTPTCANIIVAPCNGYINKIETVITPYNIDKYSNHKEYYKITFHINIFQVQLNYMPIAAEIIHMQYYFFYPQKNIIIFKAIDNNFIILTQNANLLTYSIVCDVQIKENVKIGEKIGMIKIGNTIELYIPNTYTLLLAEGQSCIGSETIIAINKNIEQNKNIQYRIH